MAFATVAVFSVASIILAAFLVSFVSCVTLLGGLCGLSSDLPSMVEFSVTFAASLVASVLASVA